jgi:hypothetical protein
MVVTKGKGGHFEPFSNSEKRWVNECLHSEKGRKSLKQAERYEGKPGQQESEPGTGIRASFTKANSYKNWEK